MQHLVTLPLAVTATHISEKFLPGLKEGRRRRSFVRKGSNSWSISLKDCVPWLTDPCATLPSCKLTEALSRSSFAKRSRAEACETPQDGCSP